ncbi:4-galactosyl-N-acetylglucosaminide 3-alpha-L-fucosyltransferase FUT6-like isoform X2 [Clavelina lepadiformis]|uniref:4-galactosyl-N-acetylglucosaminide 3-alpha-L-fucosyltransferase FUT6-like isoform X2 n=1 Tax=Clavelina lepadiformis TaxID=159417 RepID=UPI0040424E6B
MSTIMAVAQKFLKIEWSLAWARKIFFFCSFATLLTCLWIDVNYTYDVTYSNKINYFQQKETKDGKGNLSSMVFNETIRQQLKTALKLASQEKINIVVWYQPFGKFGNMLTDKENCGFCNVTADRSLIYEKETKALLFHFSNINSMTMPHYRRLDQNYVWWTAESTRSVRLAHRWKLTNFRNYFNLTMSYRLDADIVQPYGTAIGSLSSVSSRLNQDKESLLNDILKKKVKLALWAVSNCAFTSGAVYRMKFVEQLEAAGLQLDLKGKCFSGRQDVNFENYKFYLAFENSIDCEYYITEKFFVNSLAAGAVPVVLGPSRHSYETTAPPGSFIYAPDFSVHGLVEYLNYLDKNETAYRQYFEWRFRSKEDMPYQDRSYGYCQLCRVLHGINVDNLYNPLYGQNYSNIPLFGFSKKPRTIASLANAFYGNENRECLLSTMHELYTFKLFLSGCVFFLLCSVCRCLVLK